MCVLKNILELIITTAGVIVNIIIAYFAIHGKHIRDKKYCPKFKVEYKSYFPWANETEYEKKQYKTMIGKEEIDDAVYGNQSNIGKNDESINKINNELILETGVCNIGYTGNCNKNEDNNKNLAKKIKAWSFKIKIKNQGEVAAKNVQIYLNSIEKKASTSKFEDCKNILPMNFVWSFQDNEEHPTATAKSIAAGAEKYCDFLFVDEKSRCFLRTEAEFPVYDEQHNRTDNVTLQKGKYRCKLTILASNAEPYSVPIDFEYKGQWGEESEKIIEYDPGV